MSLKILILEDHPLFCDALILAVQKAAKDADIITVSTLEEGLKKTAIINPNLVLLDLTTPDAEGLESVLMFQSYFPDLKKVVVSAIEEIKIIKYVRQAGASAYIKKSADLEEMVSILSFVLDGKEYWPYMDNNNDSEEIIKRLVSLTPTQLNVLRGINNGLLNKQIAHRMNITEATVKAHVTAVFRKLGVMNRTQAVLASKLVSMKPSR